MNNDIEAKKFSISVYVLAVTIWAVFSLPSIIFNQWFPMDLGTIFKIGQNFSEWWPWVASPYSGSGRYFPFYWIYNSFQIYLFGTNVALLYLTQSAVFLTIAVTVSFILLRLTRNKRTSALFLVTFFFSSAIPENMNTLGKAEPLAFLLVCFILLFFSVEYFKKVTELFNRRKIIKYIIAASFFTLAIWTKETSIALFGFGAFGLLLTIYLEKSGRLSSHAELTKKYSSYLIILFFGYLISKIPYILSSSTVKGLVYTEYEITYKLLSENLTFYILQQPDVIIFGILGLILLLIIGKKLFFSDSVENDLHKHGYIFVASLCAMAWAYYLVLLVWRWPMPYYMLLPATIFKFCTFYGIYIANEHNLIKKLFKLLLHSVIVFCLVYAAFYTYYIALSQITYSRIYTDAMVKAYYYLHLPGKQKSLIIESYPFYAEQIGLDFDSPTGWQREYAKGIADVLDPAVTSNKQILELLHVTQAQIDENVNNVPQLGDYLLVITGSKLASWFSRGVTPYYTEDSILKIQGVYDMELVAEKKIVAPAVYVHIWTRKLVAEETYIGYKLYRILNARPKFLWKGRYPDGWIGNSASIKVFPEFGKRVLVTASTPNFNSPNRLVVMQDDVMIQDLILRDGKEFSFEIRTDGEKIPTNIQFLVEKANIPKDLKINKDTRELGMLIRVEPRQ